MYSPWSLVRYCKRHILHSLFCWIGGDRPSAGQLRIGGPFSIFFPPPTRKEGGSRSRASPARSILHVGWVHVSSISAPYVDRTSPHSVAILPAERPNARELLHLQGRAKSRAKRLDPERMDRSRTPEAWIGALSFWWMILCGFRWSRKLGKRFDH